MEKNLEKHIYKNLNTYIYRLVKNPPAMQEMQFWSLGQEDPWEMEMATHFSIFALKISWTKELAKLYSPWGLN